MKLDFAVLTYTMVLHLANAQIDILFKVDYINL